jgi:CBS domain-containing protein
MNVNRILGKSGRRAGPARDHGETAADLMTPTSLAIPETTSLDSALSLLVDKRLSAAAVVDALGQPVGIVNRSDLQSAKRDRGVRRRNSSYESLLAGPGRVRDLMTPVFFSIRAETPAERVIQEIRALRLHRLFVTADGRGVVGFINGASLFQSDLAEGAPAWGPGRERL